MITFQPHEEERIGLVQGQMPDSIQEYWVSQALYKYNIPFQFQFELFHGRDRRGGLIVDFAVWNPMMSPVLVHGNYWHRGELSGGDKTALIAIASYFNLGIDDVPILWVKKDGQTKEDVEALVRDNVAK